MTDDVLKDLRRQQERINDFLQPSRRMQEEILRSLAPVMQIKESLRMVTDNLASMGVTWDILRSMEKIGRVELADFSSIAALTAKERDLAGVTDAIKQQSRWIEEASGLSFAKDKWILADSGALAAIEKLAASQNALLDASRWLTPRPLSSAITDILHAGRSEWALSFSRVSEAPERVKELSRASEELIGKLASIEDDAEIAFRPEEAKWEATAVARVLSEMSLLPSRGEGLLLVDEQAEAFSHLRTIAEVIRYLETRSAKRLYGGFGAWLMRMAAAAAIEFRDSLARSRVEVLWPDPELDPIDERVLTALADSAELSVGELTGLLRVPYGRVDLSMKKLLERGHVVPMPRGGLSPAYRAVGMGAGAQDLRIDVAVTRGPDRDGDVTVEGRATNTTVADRFEAIQITIDAVTARGEPNGFRTIHPLPDTLDPGDSASFSTYVHLKDPSVHGSVRARLLNARRIPSRVTAPVTPKTTTYRTFHDTYSVVRQYGQGGCGVVFEVRSSSDERLALKCLDPRSASADRIKRFRQEVGWCEQERHRNVLRVIDRGISEPDGHPFYLMKFYPTTLRIAIKTRLGPAQALELFLQVLDGLSTAHAAGVIHRDIKPENILYDPAEALVVVADFGIAHFAEEELLTAIETGSGERLANFGYAAPEQRVRNGAIDRRTDLFALGSILNELFTGHAVHGLGYPAISSAAPEYGYLDSIVAKMVQYDPAARPSSIQEVRDSICAGRDGASGAAPSGAPTQ